MIINRDYSVIMQTGRAANRPVKRWEYQESRDAERGILSGIIISVIIWLLIFFFASNCRAQVVAPAIDLQKIAMLESSGNPGAWNKKEDARGLHQIRQGALKEYNKFHPKARFAMDDLWNASVSTLVAEWYLNVRIPQMIRYFKKPDTIENRLIAYNAGIAYVAHDKPTPEKTEEYLQKYFK